MNSELALNAYILLGNALLYMTNHSPDPELAGFNGALADLYARLEPLKPGEILEAVGELSADDRALLSLACRYCAAELTPEQSTNLLGLPREVAQQTIVELRLEVPAAS